MRGQFKEQPADLQAEYEQKKRELLDPQDVVAFVSRSRNVLLHHGVFNTGVTWQFTRTTQKFEADCRTDILLNRYATWSAPARRYIESKAPRLVIGAAVEEHAEAISPLYKWYQERVYEYHYPSFADFEQTFARMRVIQERIEPGSMSPFDESARFASPADRSQAGHRPTCPPQKPRAKSKGKGKKRRKK